MNLYDDKQQQIGEVNFQMGGAHVRWEEGGQKHQLVIPDHIFEAIKRLGAGAKPAIPDETDFSNLRSQYTSQGEHLEDLKRRNRELAGAVESLRRQRDVRTKMINAVLLDELEDHG